jgi:hypothetical protein
MSYDHRASQNIFAGTYSRTRLDFPNMAKSYSCRHNPMAAASSVGLEGKPMEAQA